MRFHIPPSPARSWEPAQHGGVSSILPPRVSAIIFRINKDPIRTEWLSKDEPTEWSTDPEQAIVFDTFHGADARAKEVGGHATHRDRPDQTPERPDRDLASEERRRYWWEDND